MNELAQLDRDFEALANEDRQLQGDAAQQRRKHQMPSPNAYHVIKRSFQRELWALDGALLHGLPVEELQAIEQKFEKIDSVPQGYNYPELFVTQKKPQVDRLVKKGIKSRKRQEAIDKRNRSMDSDDAEQ